MAWISRICVGRDWVTAGALIIAGLLVSGALGQWPKEPAAPRDPPKREEPAKGQEPAGKFGPRLGVERSETYYVGVLVSAEKGACSGVLATLPVPIDWPEQTVTVLKEDKSPHVKRLEYALVGNGVKQMRVRIVDLPEGEEARVVLTVKVERRELLRPDDPGQLALPERLDSKLSGYLAPSPYIESNEAAIQSLAKKVVEGKAGAWDQARAIYDWVRANVKYEDGAIKGALAALKEGTGDAEELTSLFIALCRANKIPSRMVWLPNHCYPEFYLVDREGRGHWFPCQMPGKGSSDGSFGQVAEFRPILQKGDNFTVPEKSSKRQRYVSEFLSCKTGRPQVSFVREKVNEPER